MNYRLKSGLVVLLCLAAIGPSTRPTLAQKTQENLASAQPSSTASTATKLGQPQPSKPESVIAKVHRHEVSGQPAVTLYVQNLPILTFLDDPTTEQRDARIGTQQAPANQSTRTAVVQLVSNGFTETPTANRQSAFENSDSTANSATGRAAAIATKLNQMHRQGLAADSIEVIWQPAPTGNRGEYIVQVDKLPIAAIDANTTYAETTRNAEQDALLVANRLRRVLGGAKPLTAVKGKPVLPVAKSSSGDAGAAGADWVVKRVLKGDASWYGPGFNGNLTANGETFNQNAMTAAHPSLPFGTKLRVTSHYTGRSVIVRVNDRGPYAGDRILDLSAAAAQIIGLDDAGVGPVTIEIIERNSAAIAGR
jgi:rare lipoprotein A